MHQFRNVTRDETVRYSEVQRVVSHSSNGYIENEYFLYEPENGRERGLVGRVVEEKRHDRKQED